MTAAVIFRAATPEDHPFIYSHWRKSFRNSDFAYTLTGDAYFQVQKLKMEAALQHAKAHVGYFAEDPDYLVSFIVHEVNPYGISVVHYAFVKEWFRHQGIARKMLGYIKSSVPTVFVDVTDPFFDLREKHDLPYLTARELDDFTNRNPEDPMQPFSKWFRNECVRNQKRRDKKGNK